MIDPADLALIRAAVPTEQLHGKRIVMTGGTGFVGRWMSLGVNVTALDRVAYERGEWIGQQWDYIVHLAPTPPDKVIECARKTDAPILFASSGAVFDRQPGEYARMKIASEYQLIGSRLDVRIARMFTFTGAWMKNQFAVINMITDSLSGSTLRIRSSRPSVRRSYLYAADMAVWMWRALLRGEPGGVYEIGSPYAVTMNELAEEVQRNFNPPPLIYHEPMMTYEPRPDYVPTGALVTMAQLGVAVYTPFSEAIRKTVDYYREEHENVSSL